MAKGRKAKKPNLYIVREPNGRSSRSLYGNAQPSAPAAIRRVRDAAVRDAHRPELGTEIGRLLLERKITEEQAAAGQKWATLAVAYHNAMCTPPAFPAKANFTSGPQGRELVDEELTSRRDMMARQRYEEAEDAVLCKVEGSCGADEKCLRVVRAVCEESEPALGCDMFQKLQIGLDRLANHWGLTKHRRNVRN